MGTVIFSEISSHTTKRRRTYWMDSFMHSTNHHQWCDVFSVGYTQHTPLVGEICRETSVFICRVCVCGGLCVHM